MVPSLSSLRPLLPPTSHEAWGSTRVPAELPVPFLDKSLKTLTLGYGEQSPPFQEQILKKGTQFRGHCQSVSPKLVTKPHHLEAPVKASFLYSPAFTHGGTWLLSAAREAGRTEYRGERHLGSLSTQGRSSDWDLSITYLGALIISLKTTEAESSDMLFIMVSLKAAVSSPRGSLPAGLTWESREHNSPVCQQ